MDDPALIIITMVETAKIKTKKNNQTRMNNNKLHIL